MPRYIVVRPGVDPVVEDHRAGAEEMHAIIGSWFERVRITPDIDLWCDESGLINGAPPNRLVVGRLRSVEVRGTFFIAAHDVTGEETIGLTDEQIAELMPKVKSWPHCREPGVPETVLVAGFAVRFFVDNPEAKEEELEGALKAAKRAIDALIVGLPTGVRVEATLEEI